MPPSPACRPGSRAQQEGGQEEGGQEEGGGHEKGERSLVNMYFLWSRLVRTENSRQLPSFMAIYATGESANNSSVLTKCS